MVKVLIGNKRRVSTKPEIKQDFSRNSGFRRHIIILTEEGECYVYFILFFTFLVLCHS